MAKSWEILNPEFEQILERFPTQSIPSQAPISAVRAYQEKMYSAVPQPNLQELGIFEEDCSISVRDGTKVTVRIHRPISAPEGGSPVLVAFHGGGFCIGNLNTEETLCRDWVTNFNGVAINVAYRLRPEVQFPIPQYDAFDVVKWIAVNADKLDFKVNLKAGFIVGGSSAGGNIAIVLSHLARDEKLSPPLTGVYAACPSVLDADIVPSAIPEKYRAFYTSHKNYSIDPILSQNAREYFDSFGSPTQNHFDPIISPLLYDNHSNLPPIYIQAAGIDPLRDQSIIYEKVLREENGVITKLDMFPGLPHIFWSLYAKANFSKEFRAKTVAGLGWLLDSHDVNLRSDIKM